MIEAPEISRRQKPNLDHGQDKKIVWQRSWQQTNGRRERLNGEDGAELDSFDQYLTEIARYPLLTPEQELSLAERIKLGQKAWASLKKALDLDRLPLNVSEKVQKFLGENEKIIDHQNLTRLFCEIESTNSRQIPMDEMLQQVILAKQACEHLTNSNLRLVVAVAKKYGNRRLPLMDLVQEGNFGLMRAVVKFNPKKAREKGYEKDYKFSTYATWWIRQAIQRAIGDKAREIRLPAHLQEGAVKIARTSETLYQELQRKPTVAEIAERMGISVQKVAPVVAPVDTISLETETGKDGESNLASIIPDPKHDVEEAIGKNDLKERVAKILHLLPPRERKIIVLRYGLLDGKARTLEEVSREFEVTRERIRQIEAKALRKLSSRRVRRELADYLD